jgi:hypothetical protein
MRDSLSTALAGLVIGLYVRDAWPQLDQLLALLGWN